MTEQQSQSCSAGFEGAHALARSGCLCCQCGCDVGNGGSLTTRSAPAPPARGGPRPLEPRSSMSPRRARRRTRTSWSVVRLFAVVFVVGRVGCSLYIVMRGRRDESFRRLLLNSGRGQTLSVTHLPGGRAGGAQRRNRQTDEQVPNPRKSGKGLLERIIISNRSGSSYFSIQIAAGGNVDAGHITPHKDFEYYRDKNTNELTMVLLLLRWLPQLSSHSCGAWRWRSSHCHSVGEV